MSVISRLYKAIFESERPMFRPPDVPPAGLRPTRPAIQPPPAKPAVLEIAPLRGVDVYGTKFAPGVIADLGRLRLRVRILDSHVEDGVTVIDRCDLLSVATYPEDDS